MIATTNNRTIFVVVIILAVILGFLVYAFGRQSTLPTSTLLPASTTPLPAPTSTAPIDTQLRARADAAMTAFKNQNTTEIISLTHPTKGVCFTMNTIVSVSSDKHFTRVLLQKYLNSPTKFTWGVGASGQPFVGTIKEYLSMHVYNQDYLNAPEITYNEFKGQSSIVNNAKQVYPNAQIVGYFFPGFDPQYGGLDWQAVRLAFEQYQGQWYVIGVIHDYWSP